MTAPLMPKATAVWLVENTSLTFDQIAAFCGLHMLEVKGIADGDVAQGIRGTDPITSGQLTREEIKRGEQDADYRLKMFVSKVEIPVVKTKQGPRYTPLSRRQDRPNAILWLIKSHPELKDSQIMRLVGTTKPTIDAIRTRSHWNSSNLVAQDPVTLSLCSQSELDREVQKAARRLERERKDQQKGEMPAGGTLLPVDETTAEPGEDAAPSPAVSEIMTAEVAAAQSEPAPKTQVQQEDEEAAGVFAKLAALKPKAEEQETEQDSQD